MKSFADISLRWQVLLAPLLLILAILVGLGLIAAKRLREA